MALFSRTFRSGLTIGLLIAVLVGAAAVVYEFYDTRTLKRTLRRDAVLCGVNTGLPGFSNPDSSGNWTGFDVDVCRAVAAAIFDDPKKVKFVPLDANERFKELQNRKVDILSRNSTWSMSRETDYELHFAAVTYYDGEGFMVRKSRNVESGLELGDSKVCVQANTTTQLNLADYFRANNIKYQEINFPKLDDVIKAYDSGQCDVLTTDVSQLYAIRLRLTKPVDHAILPDVISKEPLAPVVRQRDDDWLLIVKWTIYAMINAEELGVTSKNIDEALKSKKPDVMRLVGTEGAYGEELGLSKDWAARIIRHVGNYGEVYDRNVGDGSPLKIPRGLNQLWNNGGLQYAPPIR
ncbi:MAG: amino acid ABC transporter substrate-binding protein [Rhizobiales bacterium]|nr:amino acid ABC transporter substrate-binding protein [Hyphomicrobiales bacterium]